jgi:cyclophilin family peptidyl-prolyl cis-trans isomerase
MSMQWSSAPEMQLEAGKSYSAVLHTNKGDITVDLFEGDAPKTVNNFVFLAQQGYFTNVPFHRVIKGFMIQGGDPTGTGRGGPGYKFADEPVTRDYLRGTLAMANAGPNTNGSQFFIMHQDYALPKNYTIFGIVTDGIDVVDAIADVPTRMGGGGERSTPNEPITLESVDISTN